MEKGIYMRKLFDLFGKKENKQLAEQEKGKEPKLKNARSAEQKSITGSFVYGVHDTFKLLNSNDLVVVGRVKGTVNPGMAVYVSNFGDDNGSILLTTVLGLEINQRPVDTATDCLVALKLEAGQKVDIKIGSIVHTRDISIKEVHDAYISAIGDVYVLRKNLVLSEDEIVAMSITDCAEAWRLFHWFHSKNSAIESEEEKLAKRKKIEILADALCKKILAADEIYTVFNKRTGEPHLFSHTIKQNDGSYMCTPPDIMLISKAYSKAYEPMYSTEEFEIRSIENGKNKDEIYNFLGSTFYMNGACGVAILSEQTAINAGMIVPKPDYADIPQINIPVTNPELMRWMLLLGQLGHPETPDAELIYKLYYRFMSIEMTKAMFVIPMQTEGEVPTADENGKAVLQQGLKLNFPTMKGKYDRDAIRMFTDWKRLHMEYGPEWSGFLQPISGMIDVFDCAINATKFPAAGCYISKDMYEEMIKM
jgi:hypothetical protein